MDPATMMTIASTGDKVLGPTMGMAGAAANAVPAIMAMVPGKTERTFKNRIYSDISRLASGHGGMALGQRQGLQAQAMGQINAQQRAQMAELARGANQGTGASGLNQQAQQAVLRGAQQAAQVAGSNIRQQDLALAEQQRQGIDARLQQATATRIQRIGLLNEASKNMSKSLQGDGAGARDDTAGDVDAATEQIKKGIGG